LKGVPLPGRRVSHSAAGARHPVPRSGRPPTAIRSS